MNAQMRQAREVLDVMFVRMVDVCSGLHLPPPDESGGYRMIDVLGALCLVFLVNRMEQI